MWYNKKVHDINCNLILLIVWIHTLLLAAVFYHPGLFWLLGFTLPLWIICLLQIQQQARLARVEGYHYAETAKNATEKVHRMRAALDEGAHAYDMEMLIGNQQCGQPFIGSRLHTAARYKNLAGKFQQHAGLETGALTGGWGEFRTYSLSGGNLVLQIRTDTGSRKINNSFNSKLFRQIAVSPEVKLIEWVLPSFHHEGQSQMPVPVTGQPSYSYSDMHKSTFHTPELEGMIHLLDSLRKWSAEKPIGLRMAIRGTAKFRALCYAICKTGLIPDFIVVEGMSSASANKEIAKDQPMPLYEALLFVSQTLRAYGLEMKIRVIAAAGVRTSFDLLKLLALGAHAVWSAPIANSKDAAPTNTELEDAELHDRIMSATHQAMEVCGCHDISEMSLPKFFRRLDALQSNGDGSSTASRGFPGSLPISKAAFKYQVH